MNGSDAGFDRPAYNAMLSYAREAIAMLGSMTLDDLERDRKTQLALTYLIVIVGEAANRSKSVRERYSGVPWGDIIGMRNRLVHEYASINLYTVHNAVSRGLPQLIAELTGTAASNHPGNH